MKKIILIVGASGVGKDTILRTIEDKINANFVKRYITRVPDSNESNFYLDIDAFKTLKEKEYFISSWEAHGNFYAIARDHIKDGVNIISISRGAIEDFENVFDDVTTVYITIPKELLIKRLHSRGRENMDQIIQRVDRSNQKIVAKKLVEFDNSSRIETSIENFISLILSIQNEK